METAIRWSPLSTTSDARLLLADVIGRTFRLCQVTEYKKNQLKWEEISRNTNVPAFRAFDWSPLHNLVAVGEWSGLVTILGLEDGSDSLHLPIKSQRQCNAIAFNLDSLLATGLERVRNDFCLNVYDVNGWASTRKRPSSLDTKLAVIEPVRKLATSEGITSIKFFPGRPDMLACGIKATCVRTYDLRDRESNPSLQYQTSCVHNIAIDPTDENYFASAGPGKDATVLIWDRRSNVRPTSLSSSESSHDGAVLELRDVFGGPAKAESATTWSLRFSQTEPGSLGALASNGVFRIFRTRKDHVPEARLAKQGEDEARRFMQPLCLDRVDIVEQAQIEDQPLPRSGRQKWDRIVSFDFMNLLAPTGRSCAITLRGSQSIGIHQLAASAPVLAISVRSSLVTSNAFRKNPLVGLQLHSAPRKLDLSQTSKHRTGLVLRPAGQARQHRSVKPMAKSRKLEEALAVDNIQYQRACAGYSLDPQKNQKLCMADKDLRELWGWIKGGQTISRKGRMVAQRFDLSFSGVFNIWNEDWGSTFEHRKASGISAARHMPSALEELAGSLSLASFECVSTARLAARRISMHTLGFSAEKSIVASHTRELANRGARREASLFALIFGDIPSATEALNVGSSGESDLKSLSLLVRTKVPSAGGSIGSTHQELASYVRGTMHRKQNSFQNAVIIYCSTGSLSRILDDVPNLPLRYRLAIALMSLNDDKLGKYLAECYDSVLRSGKLEAVALVGLGDQIVPICDMYLKRTHDLQSVVLATSFTAPKFLHSARIAQWRSRYRDQLNIWKLYIVRMNFDRLSMALSKSASGDSAIKPPARSFVIKCHACEQPLDPATLAKSSTGTKKPRSGVSGVREVGIACPKCKTHLPRCVVCDLWHGLEATEIFQRDHEGDAAFSSSLAVCLTCNHMAHHGHQQEWFKKNLECPAPDCKCRCFSLDGISKIG